MSLDAFSAEPGRMEPPSTSALAPAKAKSVSSPSPKLSSPHQDVLSGMPICSRIERMAPRTELNSRSSALPFTSRASAAMSVRMVAMMAAVRRSLSTRSPIASTASSRLRTRLVASIVGPLVMPAEETVISAITIAPAGIGGRTGESAGEPAARPRETERMLRVDTGRGCVARVAASTRNFRGSVSASSC